MEGELKLFILILFVVNVFLSILWDIKIGIPFGGYEIYYFDNKLLDSSVSVALNTLALMIISGSLYVFTKKCKLENRFEKSYLIAFSLVIIDALVVITSLISFYTFDWIIKAARF